MGSNLTSEHTKAPLYSDHAKQVAQDFQILALPRELTPCKIPGLGPANVQRLKDHNITTVDELVGHFFLTNRDEEEFAKFLQQLGIAKLFANECAANLKTKLGGI
jgi:hypothetical protein